jgi:hypothetical protein
MTKESKENVRRLTPEVFDIDHEDIKFRSTKLALAAKNIEDAMLSIGAKPNKDYTYMDLMRWAIHHTSHPEINKDWFDTYEKDHPDYNGPVGT